MLEDKSIWFMITPKALSAIFWYSHNTEQPESYCRMMQCILIHGIYFHFPGFSAWAFFKVWVSSTNGMVGTRLIFYSCCPQNAIENTKQWRHPRRTDPHTFCQGVASYQMLWGPDSQKNIDLPGEQINDPYYENTIFCSSSQQLLCLCLGPLMDFLCWHGALQGSSARLVHCFRN